MNLFHDIKGLFLAAGLLCIVGYSDSTAAAESLEQALTGGEPHLASRLRHESVDDNVNKEADALTLRTRLGYLTDSWNGWSGKVEFEDVRTVGSVDEYAPRQSGYAVIADPEITELNQAFVQYELKGLRARYGRQRIILGNARFVGNVGWRQDEQTFEALRADYRNKHFSLTAANISAVEGITPGFDANTNHNLLQATFLKMPGGQLSAFGLWLEDDTSGDELDTFGARYEGSTTFDDTNLLLNLGYATQQAEAAAGSTNAEADYYVVEAGLEWKAIRFLAARELLGSDDGNYGFQTPLATKHAFNGWADKFLVTPAAGLQDDYLMAGGKIAGVTLKAFYHEFSADEGNRDYGSETNLLAVRPLGEHYKVGAKYADYSADTLGSDTRKYWLWAEFNF